MATRFKDSKGQRGKGKGLISALCSLLFALCASALLAADSSKIPAGAIEDKAVDGSAYSCTSAVGIDAYACPLNISPQPTAYVPNGRYLLRTDVPNTGAASVNFSSIGVEPIKKWSGGSKIDVDTGDIGAGQVVELTFDGTDMVATSLGGGGGAGSGTVSGLSDECIPKAGGATLIDSCSAMTESASAITSTKDIVSGDCSTDCRADDNSAVTGVKITTWPNESGTVNYKKLRAYWDAGGINVDGANCAAPTEQSLNGGAPEWAFSCANTTGSIFSGQTRIPTDFPTIATAKFTLVVYHATSEAISLSGAFSFQCRFDGTVKDNTFGTGQAANVSITTAHRTEQQASAAASPNGTCSPGALVKWRYVRTTSEANSANVKILGVAMEQES